MFHSRSSILERPFIVTNVKFRPASPADRARGLVGFVSATINGRLRLESMTVRTTRAGRLTLSFPSQSTARVSRRRRFFYRPTSDAARRELEHAVLTAIRHLLPAEEATP